MIYKLIFFVPESHKEAVKSAVFTVGAGAQGHYQRCSWEVLGEGQFLPNTGANPYQGKLGSVEYVAEYRVEMRVPAEAIVPVIAALKHAHPYEEPAYEVLQCLDY